MNPSLLKSLVEALGRNLLKCVPYSSSIHCAISRYYSQVLARVGTKNVVSVYLAVTGQLRIKKLMGSCVHLAIQAFARVMITLIIF